MAFTGSATVVQISDRKIRITGLSLAAAASGTIALHGHAAGPGVILPAGFSPLPYTNSEGASISLQASIQVTWEPEAVGTATAIPVACVKTGIDALDFLATLTNTHGSTATPELEIIVEWH